MAVATLGGFHQVVRRKGRQHEPHGDDRTEQREGAEDPRPHHVRPCRSTGSRAPALAGTSSAELIGESAGVPLITHGPARPPPRRVFPSRDVLAGLDPSRGRWPVNMKRS